MTLHQLKVFAVIPSTRSVALPRPYPRELHAVPAAKWTLLFLVLAVSHTHSLSLLLALSLALALSPSSTLRSRAGSTWPVGLALPEPAVCAANFPQ